MPLSSNYRWVSIGKLRILNEKRAPTGAPCVPLDDLISALERIKETPAGVRSYLKEQRRMWCGPLSSCSQFHHLLFQVGDKTVSDVAFINFDTGDSRDAGKLDSEGGHFCSHILIKKAPDSTGKHLLLLEKVPGINFTSLQAHLNWVFAKHVNQLSATENGASIKYRSMAELTGYQSKTIQEAMTTGTVLDLQFIGHEKQDAGLDEEPLIQETTSEIIWSVKKKLDLNGARRILQLGLQRLRGWEDVEQDSSQLLVRIKSDNGQIRSVPISAESEEAEEAANEALQSAVILNEFMSNFTEPLTQKHDGLREDIVSKMKQIGLNAEAS